MTMLGAFAGFFLKKLSADSKMVNSILNPNLYLGGGLYFISALLNIYLLKYLNYSVILPLTSITYIWTMIISYYLLREKVTFKKVVGVCLIMVGSLVLVIS